MVQNVKVIERATADLVWGHIRNGAANNPQYSMSRFNNQLPCKPLSSAEKAQLICYRNERLANCDSPQTLLGCLHLHEISEHVCLCVCVRAKPKG